MACDHGIGFIGELKKLGVRQYRCGECPFQTEIDPYASVDSSNLGAVPGQPHVDEKLIDAGGGILVDKDLFGHEGQ